MERPFGEERPKTGAVFSEWSLVFGRIFIPVTIIKLKTNRQRPKTIDNDQSLFFSEYYKVVILFHAAGSFLWLARKKPLQFAHGEFSKFC